MDKPTTTTRIDHKRGVELLHLGGHGRMQIEPLDDRPMGLQVEMQRDGVVVIRLLCVDNQGSHLLGEVELTAEDQPHVMRIMMMQSWQRN